MYLALAALVVAVEPARAEDAAVRYAAAYQLSGFRLRAANVCPGGDAKALVRHAFAPVSSPEFVTFSKAFPKTMQDWMAEGASRFNDGVMRDGLGAACRAAR